MAEIKAYIQHFNANVNEFDPKFVSGPYMKDEPFWPHIFATLTKAYAGLSRTKYAKKIWDGDLLPGLLALVDHPKTVEWIELLKTAIDLDKKNIDQSLYDRFRDYEPTGSSKNDTESTFQIIIKYSLNSKEWLSLVTSTPGAPSLLQAILDCYGNYVSQIVVSNKYGNLFHLKLMTGIFGVFNLFEKDEIFRMDKLKDAINYHGDLQKAKSFFDLTWFADFIYNSGHDGSKRHQIASNFYRTAWNILSIVALAESYKKLLDGTFKLEDAEDYFLYALNPSLPLNAL